MKKFLTYLLFLGLISGTACQKELVDGVLINESSFTESPGGWEINVSDFDTIYRAADFQLSGRVTSFPSPLPSSGKALLVSSTNKSDTLFTFLTKKITGLQPSQTYTISLKTDFIARLPQNDSAVFQSGQETQLFVKACVSNAAPLNYLIQQKARLNLHIGTLGEDGMHFKLLHRNALPLSQVYTSYPLESTASMFRMIPNEKGEIWVTIGTQTAFKGISQVYYDQITLTIDTI